MNLQHVGLILDGNRRWAKAHGLSASEGHQQGYDNLKDFAFYVLLDKKIPYLSAYVFSTENWSRASQEVNFIMGLVSRAMTDYLDEFHQKNIRILILGSRDKLKPSLIKSIEKAEAKTANNTGGTLALCFNYGGKKEIADAARKLMEQGVDPQEINEQAIEKALYHPEVPELDLVIRTSGEQRLSGFMLWRSAYAELIFTDKYWPEFTKQDFDECLEEFDRRERRYGA